MGAKKDKLNGLMFSKSIALLAFGGLELVVQRYSVELEVPNPVSVVVVVAGWAGAVGRQSRGSGLEKGELVMVAGGWKEEDDGGSGDTDLRIRAVFVGTGGGEQAIQLVGGSVPWPGARTTDASPDGSGVLCRHGTVRMTLAPHAYELSKKKRAGRALRQRARCLRQKQAGKRNTKRGALYEFLQA
uniref:Galectin domain-containing protein n=1 Tax=Panagrellus redivivus TaxID=6233 RepID=A0A7E4US24_PANRE